MKNRIRLIVWIVGISLVGMLLYQYPGSGSNFLSGGWSNTTIVFEDYVLFPDSTKELFINQMVSSPSVQSFAISGRVNKKSQIMVCIDSDKGNDPLLQGNVKLFME